MAWATAAFLLLSLSCRSGALQILKQLGPCSVDTDEGRVDLSPLGNSDGTARFTKLLSLKYINILVYDWNPCYDFSEVAGKDQGICQSIALCAIAEGSPGYDFGKQSSALFLVTNSQLLLRYTDSGLGSMATIVLTCSSGPDMATVTNDTDNANLIIQLKSVSACFQSVGLSVGSVLCIVFFSVLALYLMAGLIYMKIRHHVSGVELIPNRSFWKEVPALVKEGFLCTTSTVGLRRKPGYEST